VKASVFLVGLWVRYAILHEEDCELFVRIREWDVQTGHRPWKHMVKGSVNPVF